MTQSEVFLARWKDKILINLLHPPIILLIPDWLTIELVFNLVLILRENMYPAHLQILVWVQSKLKPFFLVRKYSVVLLMI